MRKPINHDILASSDVYYQVMREVKLKNIRSEYKGQVKLYADGFYHVRMHDDCRTQIKSKTEDGVYEAILRRTSPSSVSIGSVFEMKIAHDLEIGGNPNTSRTQRGHYKRFIRGSSLEDKPIGELTRNDIIKYLDNIVSSYRGRISQRMFGNILALLNGIFSYSRLNNYSDLETDQLLTDYRRGIKRGVWKSAAKNNALEVFSPDEDSALIEWILNNGWDDIRDIAILFARFTGNRPGENTALKQSDFDGYELHYNRTESRDENDNVIVSEHCKTQERESTSEILSDAALAIFNRAVELNPNGEYLFEQNGVRITNATLDHRLRRICKQIGIPQRSMNKLRKTFATDLSNQGIPEKVLQRQMGHTDIKTTRTHYIKHSTSVNAIHDIMNSCQNVELTQILQRVSQGINP